MYNTNSRVVFVFLVVVFVCLLFEVECDDNDGNYNNYFELIVCQSDFEDGTLIIDEPNTLIKLSCDITFNPKSDWIISPNEEGAYICESIDADIYGGCDKTSGSFRLGFFSAISIEADNVTLDLNGHTLSVHEEFLLQQRFFALIGVGQAPFISGQGPANFGETNINITNIKIHNGALGLSPHHGIHGNLVNNIEICNLKIFDFEVAGIQLNGFKNAYLHDIEIGASLTHVPVVGRYSQARFGLLSFREFKERLEEQLSESELNNNYVVNFLNAGKDGSKGNLNVVEIMERLIEGMDLYFDYKINGIIPNNNDKDSRQLWREAVNIFDNNVGGLPDGSALYGILLNSAGAAVDWFGASTSSMSENAILENIIIRDLNLRVNEVIGYVNSAGSVVTGPFKGVLSMNSLLDLNSFDPSTFDLSRDSYQNYHGNLLVDAQIALAIFGNDFNEIEGSTIDEEFINWALGIGNLTNGKLICNGDDMFHMDKGVVGIRIDRTNNVQMKGVTISNINNWSEFGSEFCTKLNNNNNYYGYSDYNYSTHSQTPSKPSIDYKYQGRVARGIALTDVINDILFEDIEIDNINSARGSAIGIDMLGTQTSVVHFMGDIRIDDIIAGKELTKRQDEWITSISNEAFPNHNVFACGWYSTNPYGDFVEYEYDYDDNDTHLNIVDVDGPQICPSGYLDIMITSP